MKKYHITTFILAALLGSNGYSQISEINDFLKSKFYTYSPQENHGNISMIVNKEYVADLYFGELREDETLGHKISTEKFDNLGRCIDYKCTHSGWWGVSKEEFIITYNDHESIITVHGQTNGIDIKAKYYLDSKNNILKKEECQNDTIIELERAEYNSKGLITEYQLYGKDGLLNWRRFWEYDSLDKITIERSTVLRMPFYENPTLLHTTYEYLNNKLYKTKSTSSNISKNSIFSANITTYNDQENIIEDFIVYLPNNSPQLKTNYYYNDNGELKTIICSKAEVGDEFIEYEITKYFYEKENIAPTFNFDPEDVRREMNVVLLNSITYKYNENNQLYCEEKWFEGNSLLEKKSKKLHFYDAKGNLIKSIYVESQNLNEAFENIPKTITERIITYRN